MHAGGLGGRDHLRIGLGLEAADVVLNGGVHQRDLLGQVADVSAEVLLAPLGQVGIVEPDAAPQRRPDAGQRPHQRGLAAGAGTDDAERLAGLELEADLAQHHLAGSRHRDGDLLDRKARYRIRQPHRLVRAGKRYHGVAQPLVGHAAAIKAFQLPIARSTGASARAEATETAMMAPAERSPLMVR